jgi:trehalose 6-phosphate phosphatase
VTDAVTALLAEPRSALIALDFDGTLAPIVQRPQDARLADGAYEVVTALAARIGTLAVISGRDALEVVRLGGLDGVTDLVVLGHYGMQRWRAGRLDSPAPAAGVELVRARLPVLLAEAPPGVDVEDKIHSIAVHTRQAASPRQALDDVTPALLDLAAEAGLEALPGRYVLELRPPGVDKGGALRALVAELEVTTLIVLGDDVGDLPAFRAVAELREAGAVAGLAVVVTTADPDGDDPDSAGREVPPELAAAADLELPGPDAVVAWLAGLLAMLG